MIDFPTKKIFYFFIPVIVVMGVFLTIRNNSQIPQSEGLKVVAGQKTKRAALPETDLNNNNIPDWRESLASLSYPSSPKTASSSISITEEASINLYKDYLSLKKTGALAEETVALLADNFENSLPIPDIKTYHLNDLSVMSSQNKVSLKSYGNVVIQIRNTYADRIEEQNLPANTNLEEDPFWETLKYVAGLHKNIAEELVQIEVPPGIVEEHLLLVNNQAKSVFALEDFSNTRNDPLLGLQGISTYLSLQQEELEILRKIGIFLETNGIIFGASEPGYFLSSLQ